MLVVHLALRPLTAYGLDDTAKVSAPTSGADPRSAGPTTLTTAVAHPASRRNLVRCRAAGRPARIGHRRLASLRGPRGYGKHLGAATSDQCAIARPRCCASLSSSGLPPGGAHDTS